MEDVRRHTYAYLVFSMVTSLIGTAFGISIVGESPYIAFPWLLTTIMPLITSVAGVFRVKRVSEPYGLGVVSIQHVWWVVSVGFAGVMFFPADFFVKIGGMMSITMAIISAIWLIWGFYLIYVVHEKTKAPVAP